MKSVAALTAVLLLPVQTVSWNAGTGHPLKVTLSRSRVGTAQPSRYQYRLTIPGVLESPGGDPFLTRVVEAPGGGPAFPWQTARIVGVARLQPRIAPSLVVERYEAGADCGDSEIAVFAMNAGKVRRVATVENPCGLTARIVRGSERDVVEFTGAYYKPSDPLCCPSKGRVSARLVMGADGRWAMRPAYFRVR